MSILSKMLDTLPTFSHPVVLLCGKIFLSKRSQTVLLWKLSHGDSTLCLNYPLKRSSVVFDLGGYKGDWSADIYNKYQCTVYIFEPVKEYEKILKTRFHSFKNIHILPYGLSSKTRHIYLHMSKNATSEFGKSEKLEKVKLVNVENFMREYNIKNVDLASINIEGGEYDLLGDLMKAKLIKKFKNIQVQFHPFVPDAYVRAKKIQNALRKTHKLQYQFPFVWESWRAKN